MRSVKGILLFVILIFILAPRNAYASISSCLVSVSPQSISGGSSNTITFNITNTDQDSNILYWVKVISPSGEIKITSGDGPNLGTVNVNPDESDVAINTSLSGGEAGDFNVGVKTGDSGSSNGAFTVMASGSSDGSDPTTCTGNTLVSVSPNISALLTISAVSISTSESIANISWKTGGQTSGVVSYGTTDSYGGSVVDTTVSKDHSIRISNLKPETTYHFKIKSSYTDQDTTETTDNTFTTGSKGAAVVTTVNTTTTTTKTNTVSVVVTQKDQIAPSVSLITSLEGVYKVAPEIIGKASDNGGIGKIDYSIDDGKNWINISLGNVGAKDKNFSFTPNIYEDGSYKIRLKATDSTGNEKISNSKTLVIDRLPPLAGGSVLSIGPQILTPKNSGVISIVAGIMPRLTFSAVGGPETVDVEIGESVTSATKNAENGLWSANLSVLKQGTYDVFVHSVDGAKNSTVQSITRLSVLSGGVVSFQGKPLKDAVVTVNYFDPLSLKFYVWDGNQYGQPNPQNTDENGNYKLLLPPGKYYISIQGSDSDKLNTTIFTLTESTPITSDFALTDENTFRFGPLKLRLPDFFSSQKPIELLEANNNDNEINRLLGTDFPYFKLSGIDLDSILGKPSLIAVTASWHPQTAQLLSGLNLVSKELRPQIYTIFSEERETSVNILSKKLNINFPLMADPDGVLVTPISLHSLPTYYFLDRKGVIVNVVSGLMSKEEIEKILIDL